MSGLKLQALEKAAAAAMGYEARHLADEFVGRITLHFDVFKGGAAMVLGETQTKRTHPKEVLAAARG